MHHKECLLMLYNVLPPTIFILSLGGVIVIMSRAVVRMKKEEFATSVKSFADSDTAGKGIGISGMSEVARVLKPNQKSVHAITSRIALFTAYLKKMPAGFMAAVASLKTSVASRAKVRRLGKKKTEVMAAVPEESPSPNSVIEPQHPMRGRILRIKEWAGSRSSGGAEKLAAVSRRLKERVPDVRGRLASVRKPDRAEEADNSGPENPIGEEPVIQKSRIRLSLPKRRLKETQEAENAASGTIRRITTKITSEPLQSDRVSDEEAPPVSARPGKFIGRRNIQPSSPIADAQAALIEKNYQKAEDILVSHILKHTKDTAAYMTLGQVAMERESFEEAMEIFDQVISWDAACPGAYAGLGSAAYRCGKFSRAIQALQRAHEADPDNVQVLNDLLGIAQKMDNRGLQHSIQTKLSDLGAASPQQAPVPERVA